MDNKYIIITTIAHPTEAVKKFSKLDNYKLIVVADKKTPTNWKLENCHYISMDEQDKSSLSIISELPYNHYSRKMLGYLSAITAGADVIIDTDDDNIPKSDWGFPEFDGYFESTNKGEDYFNVYKIFSDQRIWPRGFPLKRINNGVESCQDRQFEVKMSSVGVWQALADSDPDVDAIYRLTNNEPCYFNDRDPIVLNSGTVCPFNSQNTAIRKELFPLLYLPAYVSFRFTDILRGLIAQPIMWLYGYNVGFTKATVFQNRNEHDYLKDFESEVPVYLFSEKIVELVKNKVDKGLSMQENLFNAYEELYRHSIVDAKELILLNLWLNEFN